MAEAVVTISIPFQSLASSVKQLTYKKKNELLETIEEQLEEKLMRRNLLIR